MATEPLNIPFPEAHLSGRPSNEQGPEPLLLPNGLLNLPEAKLIGRPHGSRNKGRRRPRVQTPSTDNS